MPIDAAAAALAQVAHGVIAGGHLATGALDGTLGIRRRDGLMRGELPHAFAPIPWRDRMRVLPQTALLAPGLDLGVRIDLAV